ncbi:hypothetical protein F183_A47750 [Bryobacterales bacterium F-183]|nr:hypothetical protein F183_A47750 [Bryobacterales bacterium F-183]
MSKAVWLGFPALTMSLGWGLRGYIGGGPLGAMIPGAMVALALCLLLGRRARPDACAVAAAFGAVGVGFGGQMTYGQTIGLSLVAETAAWGLLGLTLKGAVWGLLGGAVAAIGLQGPQTLARANRVASLALILGCAVGWRFINEPKLVYFSDPANKPRAEIWAGLTLAAIAYLAVHRNRVAGSFGWIGMIGGGLGFGIGGAIHAWARTSGMTAPVDWWKVMEFTFGAMFGAALGYAAWKHRERIATVDEDPARLHWFALCALIPLGIAAEEKLPFRFSYTVVGAVLLPFAALNARFAWQCAITMTYAAFAFDFLESRKDWDQTMLWLAVCWTSAGVLYLVDRKRSEPLFLFLFLTWVAVADSHLKSWMPPFVWESPASWAHATVEVVFTLQAVAVTWLAYRIAGDKLVAESK